MPHIDRGLFCEVTMRRRFSPVLISHRGRRGGRRGVPWLLRRRQRHRLLARTVPNQEEIAGTAAVWEDVLVLPFKGYGVASALSSAGWPSVI